MLGHKSTQTYHDLASTIRVSFAAGIETDNRRIALRVKRAHEHRARQREFREREAKQIEVVRRS